MYGMMPGLLNFSIGVSKVRRDTQPMDIIHDLRGANRERGSSFPLYTFLRSKGT